MSQSPSEKTARIPVDRLKPGLYIDLGLHWTEHPFLFRRFRIKSDNEIAVIRGLGLREITVYPDRSTTAVDPAEAPAAQAPEPADSNPDTLWQAKNQRIEEAARYRSRRNKRSKEYAERVKQIKNLTSNLQNAPANAARDAREIAEAMTTAFEDEGNVMINLVNFTDDRFSMYHHTINVAVITLSLAKAMGIKGRELRWLCIGALLHDIGNSAIPAKVRMKQTALTSAEQKLMNTHPVLGGRLAGYLEGIAKEVIEIIEQHHEYLDGSGFPRGLKAGEISELARIVAITNCYDNLCNPRDPKRALTPKDTMAVLFAKYKNKLDSAVVQRFIQAMGVYPPGTVVSLSDGSIGLVTAVHSEALLQPMVLVYREDIPKSEALHLDLRMHEDLAIEGALKPGEYPRRIYEYLGISNATAYYFEKE